MDEHPGTEAKSDGELAFVPSKGDVPTAIRENCETQGSVAGSTATVAEQALAAAKILPDQMDQLRLELESNLIADHKPKLALAKILLGEVARDSAALEVMQQTELAALKIGMRNARKVADATAPAGVDSGEITAEDVLVAATSSDFYEKASRSRRQRQAALFRSLTLFQLVSEKFDKTRPNLTIEELRRHFPDAESCERYLKSRREVAEWPCPRCHVRSRKHWLATRHSWECSKCGAQTGLRSGSVMADSPLSLEKWFVAIGMVCIDHNTSAPQLADVIGLSRVATARRMLATILTALWSSNRDDRLVGLPTYVELGTVPPERSGAFTPISQNEKPHIMRRPMTASEHHTSS